MPFLVVCVQDPCYLEPSWCEWRGDGDTVGEVFKDWSFCHSNICVAALVSCPFQNRFENRVLILVQCDMQLVWWSWCKNLSLDITAAVLSCDWNQFSLKLNRIKLCKTCKKNRFYSRACWSGGKRLMLFFHKGATVLVWFFLVVLFLPMCFII